MIASDEAGTLDIAPIIGSVLPSTSPRLRAASYTFPPRNTADMPPAQTSGRRSRAYPGRCQGGGQFCVPNFGPMVVNSFEEPGIS